MKVFIMSQFSCCLLVWMCYSKKGNECRNRIHKKTLKLNFYDNYLEIFGESPGKHNSIKDHHKNINWNPIEFYEVKNIVSSNCAKTNSSKLNPLNT